MSTSRYIGVYPFNGHWVSRAHFHNKTTHLGAYTREIDAALAYDIVMYGEHCLGRLHLKPTNFGIPNAFLMDEYMFKRLKGYKICHSVPALKLMCYEPDPSNQQPIKYMYKEHGKWWCFYIKNYMD